MTSRRILPLIVVGLVFAAAAWFGLGIRRARPEELTLVARGEHVEEMAPGAFYRQSGARVLVTPRIASSMMGLSAAGQF